MVEKLAADFDRTTPAQLSSTRLDFLTFKIPSTESHIETRHRYDELLRKVVVQGGDVSDEDKLGTLLNALPRRFDILKESFFAISLI